MGDQRFQLADELGVPAEGERRFDPFFESDQAQLFELCDLFLSKRLVGEVSQRRPAP
jgi:hypothetical protein